MAAWKLEAILFSLHRYARGRVGRGRGLTSEIRITRLSNQNILKDLGAVQATIYQALKDQPLSLPSTGRTGGGKNEARPL